MSTGEPAKDSESSQVVTRMKREREDEDIPSHDQVKEELVEVKVEKLVELEHPPPNVRLSGALLSAVEKGNREIVEMLVRRSGAVLEEDHLVQLFQKFAGKSFPDQDMQLVIEGVPTLGDALNKVITVGAGTWFFDNKQSRDRFKTVKFTWNFTALALALLSNASDSVLEAMLTRGADPNLIYDGGVFETVEDAGHHIRGLWPVKAKKTTALHDMFRTSFAHMDIEPFPRAQLTVEQIIRMMKVLRRHGAKFDLFDGEKKTAMEFAVKTGSTELVDVMTAL